MIMIKIGKNAMNYDIVNQTHEILLVVSTDHVWLI